MKTKYFFSVLLLAVSILFTSCCKDKVEPNPLENVMGVYKGSVADGALIYSNIQANITVEKDYDGKSFIKSVGLSGPNYQLVLTRPNSEVTYIGKRGNTTYSVTAYDVSVSGGTLNVKGTSGSTNSAFSFTGAKE